MVGVFEDVVVALSPSRLREKLIVTSYVALRLVDRDGSLEEEILTLEEVVGVDELVAVNEMVLVNEADVSGVALGDSVNDTSYEMLEVLDSDSEMDLLRDIEKDRDTDCVGLVLNSLVGVSEGVTESVMDMDIELVVSGVVVMDDENVAEAEADFVGSWVALSVLDVDTESDAETVYDRVGSGDADKDSVPLEALSEMDALSVEDRLVLTLAVELPEKELLSLSEIENDGLSLREAVTEFVLVALPDIEAAVPDSSLDGDDVALLSRVVDRVALVLIDNERVELRDAERDVVELTLSESVDVTDVLDENDALMEADTVRDSSLDSLCLLMDALVDDVLLTVRVFVGDDVVDAEYDVVEDCDSESDVESDQDSVEDVDRV
jgi:hypothetical protein